MENAPITSVQQVGALQEPILGTGLCEARGQGTFYCTELNLS